jgi:hypothetical protein
MSPDQTPSESGPVPQAQGVTRIWTPSPEAVARGVACHFDWRADDLHATGDVSRGNQGLVITRVEITAPTPAGITHGLLRRVPLGDVLRFANTSNMVNDPNIVAITTGIRPAVPADEYVIPPGRVLVTDDLLRHVALAYLEESRPGKDRAVLQRLEERLGRPKGTVRGWVQRARETGWLGAAVQGRMGAEPGPKLISWFGDQMSNDEALQKEARVVAAALGAADPETAAVAAVRAYRDPAEFEYPSRVVMAPLTLSIVAQVLYERSVGAELAARTSSGADEDAALDEIAHEVREKIAQHEQ